MLRLTSRPSSGFLFPGILFSVVVVVCTYESHETDAGLKQAGIDRCARFTMAPSQFSGLVNVSLASLEVEKKISNQLFSTLSR